MAISATPLNALPSRRAQVIETLQAALVAGEMEPGVIYSAPALAAQFGVSATPVREAMLYLAREGLIEVVRNRGFRVAEPEERDLDELLELRELLEVPTVAKVARSSPPPATIARLERLAEATIDAARAGDMTEHVKSDIAFHLELLAEGGNRQLVELMRTLRARSRLFGIQAPANAERVVETTEEHRELIRLIAAGDARGAQSVMRRHIRHSREWRAP